MGADVALEGFRKALVGPQSPPFPLGQGGGNKGTGRVLSGCWSVACGTEIALAGGSRAGAGAFGVSAGGFCGGTRGLLG